MTFNVTEPANALNVRYTIPDGASGQLDVRLMDQALVILICHLIQHGSTLKVTMNMIKLSMAQVHVFVLMRHVTILKDIQLKSGDKISLVRKER